MFNSLKLAFAMYSRIPMPRADWSAPKMKYVLAFLPFVGAAVGGVLLLWDFLAAKAGAGDILVAAGRVLTPILVTGGIHMDGFLDTVDARRSYQSPERKLEIMKDPHTGAFAIIYGGAYLLAMFGLFSAISPRNLRAVALGYMLSRAFAGISVVSFRGAKETGLAADFRHSAEKKTVFAVLVAIAAASAAGMAALSPVGGTLAACGAAAAFAWYRRFSYREFGGVTGDLAGYYIQVSEMVMAAAAAAATLLGY